jgi:hypothetical protein
MQDLSDLIATTVIEDILGLNTPGDPDDDNKISALPQLIQNDVSVVLGFDSGSRPLAAWGGTPLAESKLGLDGWLDAAITSGDDLRIFFEASGAAIGAAFLAAGRTMDLSMLGDDDALSLHAVVLEIQKIVNNYEATGQPVDWDSIYSAQHDRLFKILKGAALDAIDPDDPALAALTDEVHAELYSTLATFAEQMSPGLPGNAAQEAANAGQTLLIGSVNSNEINGNDRSNIVFGGHGDDTISGETATTRSPATPARTR